MGHKSLIGSAKLLTVRAGTFWMPLVRQRILQPRQMTSCRLEALARVRNTEQDAFEQCRRAGSAVQARPLVPVQHAVCLAMFSVKRRFGRVGGLLRSIEDEMNDMITRFGGPSLLDPALDVLDVAVSRCQL